MAKYAIIKNELVINVIEADEKFVIEHYPDAVEAPNEIGVGDKYIDEKFISNQSVIENENLA